MVHNTVTTNKGPTAKPGHGRQKFIDAAIAIVARDGFDALTTRAVVRAAGSSQGSLQHHFPTMSTLVVAALHECVTVTTRFIDDSVGLTGLLDGVLDLLRQEPDATIFQTEVFAQARLKPELMVEVTAVQRAYESAIESSLSRHHDADTLAGMTSMLSTVADGLIYQYTVFGRARLAKLADQVTDIKVLLGKWSPNLR